MKVGPRPQWRRMTVGRRAPGAKKGLLEIRPEKELTMHSP
jgi:hypothetical protein